MARLAGYPSLRDVIDGTEPSDPLTTVDRIGGIVTVVLTEEGVTLAISADSASPDRVSVTGRDGKGGLVRLPEGTVRRANTLLRDGGVTLLPDWRSGTHTLREGNGKRTRLQDGGEVSAVLSAGPVATPGTAPVRPATAPTVAHGDPSQPLGGPAGLTERGAFSGDLFVPDEVQRVWATADHGHAHGLPSTVFLQGPPGTGKTHMAKGLSLQEGRAVTEHQCFGMDEPTDWFGQIGFAHGQTTFTPTPLYWALTMPGARTLILDEVNRASARAMNALMPLLAGEPTLTMPHDGHPIVVAPDLKIVLTANIGSGYSGTSQIDPALNDRKTFAVEVPYLPPEQERDLLVGRMALHGLLLHEWQAETLVRFANEVRKASVSGDVTPVSARQLLAAAQAACAPGNTLLQAVEMTVLVDYSREGGEASEWTAITSIVAGLYWDDPATRPLEPDWTGPHYMTDTNLQDGNRTGAWCPLEGPHSHRVTTMPEGTVVEAVQS